MTVSRQWQKPKLPSPMQAKGRHDKERECLEHGHPHPPFRKGTQIERVHWVMRDGEWHTAGWIAHCARLDSDNAARGRLRELRRAKQHSHIVQHEKRLDLLWYKMEEKSDV